MGYPDDQKVLFRAPDVLLWREECAALIGPNGAGKTTFLKTLLGELAPLDGQVKLGSSLKVGYFAQAHEGLDPERTPLEEILSVQEMSPGRARDYLAKFLFSGDDVFKKIEVLSGGERGRVALAKLALEGANLLLLDEPTNHLDIPSQEILQEVLADFPGTILLVSHDRYLIDALATQIWSVEDRALEVFRGSWTEYVAARDGGRAGASGNAAPGGQSGAQSRGVRASVGASGKLAAPAGKSARPAGRAAGTSSKAVKAGNGRAETAGDTAGSSNSAETGMRRQKADERKRATKLATLETAIAALEQRLARLSRELEDASTGGEVDRARALGEEYALVQSELSGRLLDWEQLAA